MSDYFTQALKQTHSKKNIIQMGKQKKLHNNIYVKIHLLLVLSASMALYYCCGILQYFEPIH